MARSEGKRVCVRTLAMAVQGCVFLTSLVVGELAHAQQLNVLASFLGGNGEQPVAGLILDAAGNLYGTTFYGGSNGYGTVYKLSHHGAQWILTELYAFRGHSDGNFPWGGVVFGPDGALYGTTFAGGIEDCQGFGFLGCGTVFRLTPPPNICQTVSCPWTKTILHSFTGGSDGGNPQGELIFDHAGNFYGTTWFGGQGSGSGNGVVYEVSPTNGGWNIATLWAFSGGLEGQSPVDGVVIDRSGNLFGTTGWGGLVQGVVYELTNGASGWTETVLHDFAGGSDGYSPSAVAIDALGNIYGMTTSGDGTAYELQPSGVGFNYSIIYNFNSTSGGPSFDAAFNFDNAGNLYTTTEGGGSNGAGAILKFLPSGGTWNLTILYSFDVQNGYEPACKPAFDAQGNLYGTTTYGGEGNNGVAWQLTP